MSHELLESVKDQIQAEILQNKWRSFIELSERQNKIELISDIEQIRLVCGVDVTYLSNDADTTGVACAVLWDLQTNSKVSHVILEQNVNFPYIPNYLSFREARALAAVIHALPQVPDLILVDGNGILHKRRFGLATHLGVALDIPTIGIAKKLLNGFEVNGVGDIVDEISHEKVGLCVKLAKDKKPVFISVGYQTTLELAKAVCEKCTQNHQIPEPIWLADQYSRNRRAQIKKSLLKSS